MSRRSLGASLPPEVRLVAYEARIRAFQEAVDELGLGLLACTTGEDLDGAPISARRANSMLLQANHRLQELRTAPIRPPVKRHPRYAPPGRRR